MHDQLWDNLKKSIDALSDDERRELLGRLKRSVEQGTPLEAGHAIGVGANTAGKSQKRAWQELFAELAELPLHNEPDDDLSGSRDHDEILYGRK